MALNYKSSLARYRRYLQIAEQKPLWKATLFLSLSLILVVVLLVVAIKPTATKIAELGGKIEKQEVLSAQLNEKIVQDQQAAKLLEQIDDRLYLLFEGLPAIANWKEWSISFETAAAKNGVQIESLLIGETQIKGKYIGKSNPATQDKSGLPDQVTSITVNGVLSGEYFQLVQFVDDLEKTRRILVLNSVQFDKQSDGKLKLIINGEIGYVSEYTDI